MGVEIERKFLVLTDEFKKSSYKKSIIRQGFLNTDKDRTVRVRITDEVGFITIKSKSNASSISRKEWEYQIPKQEAEEMLLICEPSIIEKERYFVKHHGFIFEIDVFKGENKGLIVAEIELETEDQNFEKPLWLGEEVTGNKMYYNSYLSKHPFIKH